MIAIIAALPIALVCCDKTKNHKNFKSDTPTADSGPADSGPADYEIKVTQRDIYGFWVLTQSSRNALKNIINEIPAPDKDSNIIPMSSEEVGMRTWIIAFSYEYDPLLGLYGHEKDPSNIKLGLIEKYPLGYGPHADTLLNFSWELNNDGMTQESMFSPDNIPIAEAKQWLDIKYIAIHPMIAYERYYILKRNGYIRLQAHVWVNSSKSVLLEWIKLDESKPYEIREPTLIK